MQKMWRFNGHNKKYKNHGQLWNCQEDLEGLHKQPESYSSYNEHGARFQICRRMPIKKPDYPNNHSRRDLKPQHNNNTQTHEGSSPRRGSYSRRGRRGSFGRNVQERLNNDTGWFLVRVPNGSNFDKRSLLNSLKTFIAPIELTPIMYEESGCDVFFHIDDYLAAKELLRANKRITLHGGTKVTIIVTSCTPYVDVTIQLKEKIKLAMAKRYSAERNALDLSRFHADPDLVGDYFCTISQPHVFSVIIKIINDQIPRLEALNLDQNSIAGTDILWLLARRTPHLRILHLAKSNIGHLSSLNVIRKLPLEELNLEGNALCSNYYSKTEYHKAVLKMFPKLVTLDGVDLAPIYGSEIEKMTVDLPDSDSSMQCTDEITKIALKFLTQYFELYDGMERSGVINAYHESAKFLLILTYNSLRLQSTESEREELAKEGKVEISKSLCKLPRTQHDPGSFTLDVPIYDSAQKLLTVSMTGMFKEPDAQGEPLRHFSRKFVLLLSDLGVSIVNEILHVTNATQNQVKNSLAAALQPELVVVPKSPVNNRMDVVLSFSAHTGMKMEWSQKCLEENAWNVPMSLEVFARFKQDGLIPQEAFIM